MAFLFIKIKEMILMKLQDAFNETRTDNGDRAYNSTKNEYLDVISSIPK